MKKIKFALLAVGLMVLASCGEAPTTTANPTTEPDRTIIVNTNTDTTTTVEPTTVETTSVAPVKKKAKVILLGGQSNMVGFTLSSCLISNGETTSEERAQYKVGYKSVQIDFYCEGINSNKHNFCETKLGQGRTTAQFGPEVGIAATLDAAGLATNDEPVYLIKWAWGGSNLYAQWDSDSTSNYYAKFIDYTYEAFDELDAMGVEYEVAAMCWMQGEADACNINQTNYYKENTIDLINAVRDEFCDYAPEDGLIKFIDAGISDCSTWTYHQKINQAKEEVADEVEGVYYFSTIDNGITYNKEPTSQGGSIDYYHFDSASMIKLGKLFGDEIAQHCF